MKTPHKHAECIKAWANGAEIEEKGSPSWPWVQRDDPRWNTDVEYRVKPEPMLSERAQLLVAQLVTCTEKNGVTGEHSIEQWSAYKALEAYILELEQKS